MEASPIFGNGNGNGNGNGITKKEGMKAFFCRLFNVYPGEEVLAWQLALLGFLWTVAITSGLKNADALFLLHVGAGSLPATYAIIASVMIVLASMMLWAFHNYDTHVIFLTALSTAIAYYAFIAFCFFSGAGLTSDWIWFVLRVCGYILLSVHSTCYWSFIDQYYHLQDAKRLYSFFSTAIFMGVAATGVIMNLGWLEFSWVSVGIVISLIASFFLIKKITAQAQPVHDENSLQESAAHSDYTVGEMIRGIVTSRFSLLLMASNFLAFLLMTLTEYNYLAAFDHYFDPGAGTHPYTGESQDAQLTLFLGRCTAMVSISNILFGLFIYSRWVRRFGIASILPVTPLILILTYTGWITAPSLLFAVMGFFVVEGTMYVIDDSNFNLMLNAVPAKLKYKIRIAIESFFEPVGMLVTSLLLTFSLLNVKVVGLLLALLSLTIALLLGGRYAKAIYKNLLENAIHFEKAPWVWFSLMGKREQTAAEGSLLKILRREDEPIQMMAVEALIDFDDRAIVKKFLDSADSFSDEAKIEFLELLTDSNFATDHRVLDHLWTWLNDTASSALKETIHFYLAKQGLLHPEKVVHDLHDSNLTRRAAAILSLKKSWAHIEPATATKYRTMAAHGLQQLLNSHDEGEIAMGLYLVGFDGTPYDVDILVPYLRHPVIKVARQAIKSLGALADESGFRYARTLIKTLTQNSDNEYRLHCLTALEKIGDSTLVRDILAATTHFRPNERRKTEDIIVAMGLRTVPALLAHTKDSSMNDRTRILSGRILGRLAPPQLRANLYDIVADEIERAYFYYYHHCTLPKEEEGVELTLLKSALLTSYRSVLDFTIQLLGVAGEAEECELLSRSLRSKNPKVRGQVVETLEKSCDTTLFRLLYPLVTDVPESERLKAYLKGGRTPLSLKELLDKLSLSSSQLDRMIAATFKQRLNIPNWRETLRRQMASHEEIFHHFAYELLEQ